MCQLLPMTRAELEAMTKDAIIEAILDGVVTETITKRKFDKDTGELTFIATVITDAYTGSVIDTVEVKTKNYSTGEVDEITVEKKDSEGKVKEKYKIKHQRDGKGKPVKIAEITMLTKDPVIKI